MEIDSQQDYQWSKSVNHENDYFLSENWLGSIPNENEVNVIDQDQIGPWEQNVNEIIQINGFLKKNHLSDIKPSQRQQKSQRTKLNKSALQCNSTEADDQIMSIQLNRNQKSQQQNRMQYSQQQKAKADNSFENSNINTDEDFNIITQKNKKTPNANFSNMLIPKLKRGNQAYCIQNQSKMQCKTETSSPRVLNIGNPIKNYQKPKIMSEIQEFLQKIRIENNKKQEQMRVQQQQQMKILTENLIKQPQSQYQENLYNLKLIQQKNNNYSKQSIESSENQITIKQQKDKNINILIKKEYAKLAKQNPNSYISDIRKISINQKKTSFKKIMPFVMKNMAIIMQNKENTDTEQSRINTDQNFSNLDSLEKGKSLGRDQKKMNFKNFNQYRGKFQLLPHIHQQMQLKRVNIQE